MTRSPRQYRAPQKKEPPKEPLTPNHPVAYAICARVYGGRCGCRDAKRNHICDAMLGAARSARLLIEAQTTK